MWLPYLNYFDILLLPLEESPNSFTWIIRPFQILCFSYLSRNYSLLSLTWSQIYADYTEVLQYNKYSKRSFSYFQGILQDVQSMRSISLLHLTLTIPLSKSMPTIFSHFFSKLSYNKYTIKNINFTNISVQFAKFLHVWISALPPAGSNYKRFLIFQKHSCSFLVNSYHPQGNNFVTFSNRQRLIILWGVSWIG